MIKLSSTLIATAFAATLFAAPAMAAGENQGNGGHAARAGGSGGVAKSGGGAPRNATAHIQRSSPNVVIRQKSGGGGNARAYVAPNRHVEREHVERRHVERRHVERRHAEHNGGHRGTRYLWGGLPFYFYDGYYHGDCGWLRRRAEATGSRYWWVRYRQCREDD